MTGSLSFCTHPGACPLGLLRGWHVLHFRHIATTLYVEKSEDLLVKKVIGFRIHEIEPIFVDQHNLHLDPLVPAILTGMGAQGIAYASPKECCFDHGFFFLATAGTCYDRHEVSPFLIKLLFKVRITRQRDKDAACATEAVHKKAGASTGHKMMMSKPSETDASQERLFIGMFHREISGPCQQYCVKLNVPDTALLLLMYFVQQCDGVNSEFLG
ncbi:MAG: hypothetical protein M5R41_14025 [Bacteroidia bacterium]|nr:hypothetical protein [Bacteroidia bacterium]